MTKFRKKSEIVDAVQWFVGDPLLNGMIHSFGLYYIQTPKGIIQVNHGDWIINGIEPCKPSELEKTYESSSILADERDIEEWKDAPYSVFSNVRWSYKWRTRGILAEAEIKRLQEKIAKLQEVVEDIISRNNILQDIGPDASGADGDFIHADWLEEIGEAAKEVLNG